MRRGVYRMKRQLEEVIENAKSLMKNTKQTRFQRMKIKVNDMSSVVFSLTQEGVINDDKAEILNNNII